MSLLFGTDYNSHLHSEKFLTVISVAANATHIMNLLNIENLNECKTQFYLKYVLGIMSAVSQAKKEFYEILLPNIKRLFIFLRDKVNNYN